MIALVASVLLSQCYGQRTYVRSYVAPTYYAQPVYQAAAPVQQYQAPAVNYSLVGDYMRQESQYQQQVQQNAKLDVLLKLLAERPAPQPVQPYQPPPTFATPQQPSKAPPVQYEQPQLPAKSTPQFESPYPAPQQPYDQPPYGTKPPPAASPALSPSFESSSWVPPVGGPGGGGGAGGVAAMTALIQNRCVDCHVGSAEKGGGVKLLELDGQLADISPYLDDIGKDVASGRMPKKGGRLNNQELYMMFAGLREYAATTRGRQNVLASFGQ